GDWPDGTQGLVRGRVYIPAEDLERHGVAVADLRERPAPPGVRALIGFEVARARRILDEGAPLVRTLRGRPRLAVAAFVAGGHAALDAVDRAGGHVSAGPPRAGSASRSWALVRVLARGRRAAWRPPTPPAPPARGSRASP